MMQSWLAPTALLFSRSPSAGSRIASLQWVALACIVAAASVVRLMGIDDIGLHGDEETMAMAVHHIVTAGTPHLPSGMFYPRALAQLYLMAGSVWLFGENEWALRLPSVLCGIALVPLTFFLGRRFLRPPFALLLAVVVAFLPEFIEYSQTARMYIFMVTSLVVFTLFIFAWEKSTSLWHLAGALVAFLVAVQFHSLCVLALPLFFLPGILRGDIRLIVQGLAASVLAAAGYWGINGFVEGQYPDVPERDTAVDSLRAGRRSLVVSDTFAWPLVGGAIAWCALVLWMMRGIPGSLRKWSAAALLVAGIAAQALVYYHVAAGILVIAAVLAWPLWEDASQRTVRGGISLGTRTVAGIVILSGVALVLAVMHIVDLHQAGVESITRIIGALTGVPSLWPYARLGGFSLVALAIVGLGLLQALWRLARRRQIPDYWLYFLIAVLAPLLAIGMARWNVPTRYVAGSVIPMLLVAVAVLQGFFDALASARSPALASGALRMALVVAVGVLMIGPLKYSSSVNTAYAHHPDHKGAADFMRTLPRASGDIVVAEDVLQQTWYLGKVDYWLISPEVGALFSEEVDGAQRDIYTHTRILDDTAQLQALLAGPGSVYLIGSGENQRDGRRAMRGDSLHEWLNQGHLETLYEGRDGRTRVWKLHSEKASALPVRPRTARASAAADRRRPDLAEAGR